MSLKSSSINAASIRGIGTFFIILKRVEIYKSKPKFSFLSNDDVVVYIFLYKLNIL